MKNKSILLIVFLAMTLLLGLVFAEGPKQPSASGVFYPDERVRLSAMVDNLILSVPIQKQNGEIIALILPHAGYGFSGETAAFGYKLIIGSRYNTVVVIGTGHRYGFNGVSVYNKGSFLTPLGSIKVDEDFSGKLLSSDDDIIFEPRAFSEEHSVEVQLPFLQRALKDFKIVPVIMGDCSLSTCKKFANLLKEAIGGREDVLIIVSTDLYHGYDFNEASKIDKLTISFIENMDAEGLYYGLRENKLEACGGFGVVTALILGKEIGVNEVKLLKYTNSAEVTAKKINGIWTVGYASLSLNRNEAHATRKENTMLNDGEKKKLLGIARKSIETYLKTGRKYELNETDPSFTREAGAFVTLNKNGELRGCIGNLVGNKPLYLTVRDMAVEAAVSDPRFTPVRSEELKDIEIEISVLSPMNKVDDPAKIRLGVDGVLVRRGFRSGVFLPQVAVETGWSKEEFLSNLCSHKAGLSPNAWKDKETELFTFTAEVFSEKEL